MHHDPFQTYATTGMFSAAANPLTSPFATTQLGQPFGMPQNLGLQQLQAAAFLAAQTNPQLLGLSPLTYNPAGLFSNPLLMAGLQNPYTNPLLQNPFITGAVANQLLTGGIQNPLQTSIIANPLLAAAIGNPLINGIQNPLLNPLSAIYSNPFQTGFGYPQVSPFSQLGNLGSPIGQTGPLGQIGYPLAPQSFLGQSSPFGGGQGFTQSYPLLQQLAARQYQVPGLGMVTY